jgi:hypothetical protein
MSPVRNSPASTGWASTASACTVITARSVHNEIRGLRATGATGARVSTPEEAISSVSTYASGMSLILILMRGQLA